MKAATTSPPSSLATHHRGFSHRLGSVMSASMLLAMTLSQSGSRLTSGLIQSWASAGLEVHVKLKEVSGIRDSLRQRTNERPPKTDSAHATVESAAHPGRRPTRAMISPCVIENHASGWRDQARQALLICSRSV